MTKKDIISTMEHCREVIYCAVMDILVTEPNMSIDLDLTRATGEKITKVYIEYETYSSGDVLDYAAVVIDGEVFSFWELDLQEMIIIADQL
jgi:hypothetical protein